MIIPSVDLLPMAVFLLAIGLCIGSFLNVVIWRLPLEGMSIVRPGSHCPSCGASIRPTDNVPVLSWLLLGGKCRSCRASISVRYPLVELLVGAGFVAVGYGAWLSGATGWALASVLVRDLVFFGLMVPITFIDIDHRIIPDELSLGGLVAGLLLSFAPGGEWGDALLGGLVGGGFLYLTAWGYEKVRKVEGMGGGDIKLIAMIGAFVGWRGVILTIFAASMLGLVAGFAAMRKGGDGMRTAIPFGPFLCAGGLLARYAGDVAWDRLFVGVL